MHFFDFADALVNRALRKTRSFEKAFIQAKSTIAKWEKQQGIEASDPQISIGRNIRQKLGNLRFEVANMHMANKQYLEIPELVIRI